jgi:hypothetical protein
MQSQFWREGILAPRDESVELHPSMHWQDTANSIAEIFLPGSCYARTPEWMAFAVLAVACVIRPSALISRSENDYITRLARQSRRTQCVAQAQPGNERI